MVPLSADFTSVLTSSLSSSLLSLFFSCEGLGVSSVPDPASESEFDDELELDEDELSDLEPDFSKEEQEMMIIDISQHDIVKVVVKIESLDSRGKNRTQLKSQTRLIISYIFSCTGILFI